MAKSGVTRCGSPSIRTDNPYRVSIWAICSRFWFIRKLAMPTGHRTSTSRDRRRVPSSSTWRRMDNAQGCRQSGSSPCRGRPDRVASLPRSSPGARRWRLISIRPKPEMRPTCMRARSVFSLSFIRFSTAACVVASFVHVDEVDDDQPCKVTQPQLSRDFLGGLEVGLKVAVSSIDPSLVDRPEFTSIATSASVMPITI